jgi:protein-S-isoprenylcysteine O-methyltransferase Ste14
MLERLRERGLTEFAARFTIGALFTLLCTNLFAEFMRTGHLTGLMLVASESLVVIFTVLRRRATLVDRSAWAAAVTCISLGGPWLLRANDTPALVADWVTALISALGLCLVVIAKITLGRSFGLMPANRGVIVAGPYTFMRHPIYTGYLVTHVAFLFAHPDVWNIALIAIADGALIWRALMEERILCDDAEYRSYCQRVGWHLVPGVF